MNLCQRERLYYVNAVRNKVQSKERPFMQWHSILGHINYESLLNMPNLVEGMKFTNKKKKSCRVCIENKTKKYINKSPDLRGQRPLDFIHSDIYELNIQDTVNDIRYMIVFVDDHSGFLMVYPMRSKDEAAVCFEKYIAFTSRFGSINRIRTDQGMEYLSKRFQQICTQNNIHKEASVARNPHQNGTAERAWGTLSTRARCMLNGNNMTDRLWPFAMCYAAYVYNRSPIARTKCTPYELLYAHKPNVAKLQKFGCLMYGLNSTHHNKMAKRTISGCFIGFCPLSGGYLLWEPNSETLQIFAQATFITDDRVNSHDDNVAPALQDNSGYNKSQIRNPCRNAPLENNASSSSNSCPSGNYQGSTTSATTSAQIPTAGMGQHGNLSSSEGQSCPPHQSPHQWNGEDSNMRVTPSTSAAGDTQSSDADTLSSVAPDNGTRLENTADFLVTDGTGNIKHSVDCPADVNDLNHKNWDDNNVYKLDNNIVNNLDNNLDLSNHSNHVCNRTSKRNKTYVQRFGNPVSSELIDLYGINNVSNKPRHGYAHREHMMNVCVLRYVYNIDIVPNTYKQAMLYRDADMARSYGGRNGQFIRT